MTKSKTLTVSIPLDLLEQLAPENPMNDDEQGGCIWCLHKGKESIYAGQDAEDHYEDCPWIAARKIIAEAKGTTK